MRVGEVVLVGGGGGKVVGRGGGKGELIAYKLHPGR